MESMEYTQLQNIKWDGHDAIRLAAGGYEMVFVPDMGANVISLSYNFGEYDIIRTPPTADHLINDPFAYGIPILYPPNRIRYGTFTYDGLTYKFPQNYPNQVHIHGILYNRAWNLVEAHVDETTDTGTIVAECRTVDSPGLFEYIPQDILFRITYTLNKDGLKQTFYVENFGKHSFPFGISYHTAFNIPFRKGGAAEEVRLHVPIEEKFELDQDMFPMLQKAGLDDKEKMIADPSGWPPLSCPIDCFYTGIPSKNHAVIKDVVSGKSIIYQVDNPYNYWIIWNKTSKEGFVCIEPQTWMVDAPNITELSPLELGVVLIGPGASYALDTRIYLK
ncbi:MAG: galactose mutarotase [Bacilli bacterium]|nr:galactose mutarotase [Bacilli bacterium]